MNHIWVRNLASKVVSKEVGGCGGHVPMMSEYCKKRYREKVMLENEEKYWEKKLDSGDEELSADDHDRLVGHMRKIRGKSSEGKRNKK